MAFYVGKEKVIVFDEARPAMGGRYVIQHGVNKGDLFNVTRIIEPQAEYPLGELQNHNDNSDIISWRGLNPAVLGMVWKEDEDS